MIDKNTEQIAVEIASQFSDYLSGECEDYLIELIKDELDRAHKLPSNKLIVTI